MTVEMTLKKTIQNQPSRCQGWIGQQEDAGRDSPDWEIKMGFVKCEQKLCSSEGRLWEGACWGSDGTDELQRGWRALPIITRSLDFYLGHEGEPLKNSL